VVVIQWNTRKLILVGTNQSNILAFPLPNGSLESGVESKEEGEAQQGGLPLSGNYFNFYPLGR
jgi:hypothetical protein